MPDIHISIREKVAQLIGAPQIVCGNSDYTAVFDFDSDWDGFTNKTMRIVWHDTATGKLMHTDVLFKDNTAVLPAIYNAFHVLIGVYAGNIRTTTPALVKCCGCITDSASVHPEPPPDVYAQLLAYLEELAKPSEGVIIGTASLAAAGTAQYVAGIAEYSEVE